MGGINDKIAEKFNRVAISIFENFPLIVNTLVLKMQPRILLQFFQRSIYLNISCSGHKYVSCGVRPHRNVAITHLC